MTNPSQLQYLNAMGIPVWVSRELVIDEELALVSEDDVNQETINTIAKKMTANSGAANAVENILQDLERNTETTAETKPSKQHSTKTNVSVKPNLQAQKTSHTSISNVFAKTEQFTVYAHGSLDADWMVIGQNPEFIEHKQGEPYAGEEGDLLENILRAGGIANPRNDAYLINVLHNALQNNADIKSSKSELHVILQDCIKQVQPKIILIVGQLAAQNVLDSDEPLARLRGKPYVLNEANTRVIVTYYPSYLLSKPMDKRKAWDDLQLAVKMISEK